MHVTNKRIMVVKSEAIPGTAVSLASADFDVRLRATEVQTQAEADDENSKFANGGHGEDLAIVGIRSGTLKASCKITGVSAIATDTPKWFKVLKGCGLVEKNYGTAPIIGRALQPLAVGDCQTLTGRIFDIECGASPVAIAEELSGMMGTLVIGAESPGKPVLAEIEFSGKHTAQVDVANTSIPVLTAPSTVEALPFLSVAVTITPRGGPAYTAKGQMFSLDTGNTIAAIKDSAQATGIIYNSVRSRAPRLSLQFLRETAALFAAKSIRDNGTLCAITIAFGSGGKKFELNIPNAQVTSYSIDDVDGTDAYTISARCLPNNGTVAAIIDEACWELLIGARA